jgi:stalled ribosome alternative rescue factor ArfA
MSFQTKATALLGRNLELEARREGRICRSAQFKPKKGKGSYTRTKKIEVER